MVRLLALTATLLFPALPLAAQAGGEGPGRGGSPAEGGATVEGGPLVVTGSDGAATPMVTIPGRAFVPPYAASGRDRVDVPTFRLDTVPVTEKDFLAFVEAEPEWRKDRAPAILVGDGYLSHWRGPLEPPATRSALRHPVTRVSWFAARAYCAWRGARLPTTDEWEMAARASQDRVDAFRDPTFNRTTLRLLQARPSPEALPPVGTTFRNAYGVWDLHGLVQEWTEDFNNLTLTGAGRDDQGLDRRLFCAAGSVAATDRSDYAAFLRHAFRADLEGSDTSPLLGFRCAHTP